MSWTAWPGSGRERESTRLDVDGETFEAARDPEQPGAVHFTWVSGPNPGYGFTSRRSDQGEMTEEEQVDAIRGFLAQIDPVTGYID